MEICFGNKRGWIVGALMTVTPWLDGGTALGGGWVSGGGELVRDAQNPWFIQNTAEVRYCITQDTEHFGARPADARRRVAQALRYWQVEFARAASFDERVVKVATQTFTEVGCDAPHELAFQLGVLTGEQIRHIGDPRHFVSLAIRTAYDPKTLRGEGFIYVAPDSGPLRPEAGGLVANPWSLGDGGLLYRVLVHELGHVFGLQHSGAAPRETGAGIMSAMWPEVMLSPDGAEVRAADDLLPNYFKFDFRDVAIRDYCSTGTHPTLIAFFGLPAGSRCWRVALENGNFNVYGGADADHLVKAGTITMTAPMAERYRPAVTLWISPEQEIYPGVAAPGEYVGGPMIEETFAKGIYRSTGGGIERAMVVNYPGFDTDWPPMTAILDGSLVMFR